VAKPIRIVSLDLCTDQLLVELVDRARIAAVTHLAADPTVSAIPEKARGIPTMTGLDLASRVSTRERYEWSKPVEACSPSEIVARPPEPRHHVVAYDFGIKHRRSPVATAGAEPQGEALIAVSTGAWRVAASRRSRPRPSSIGQRHGIGPGSLTDAALAAAGYRNMAGDYHLTRGGRAPLEVLLADPPDLLVLSSGAEEYRTALADNLRHPALRLLRQRQASIELPWRHWLCGTPHVVEAVERLAEARARIGARGR
jgi:iron complex transport system substrate-binding protein